MNRRYLPQGVEGYDPISLLKAQLSIYLGEASPERKLDFLGSTHIWSF